MPKPTTLLEGLRAQLAEMTDVLAELVRVESPSSDIAATARCAEVVSRLGGQLLGSAPETIQVDGAVHLRWAFGEPRVLLLGHLDTVWPLGTLAELPFAVDGGRATGPGVFDMKGGLVVLFYALAALDGLDGVRVLLTSDEEIGSAKSEALILELARAVNAALVLEPPVDGALKLARKGISQYTLVAHGRAAHAGLDPELGVNATVELAAQVPHVLALVDAALGTTVTPTVLSAGTTTNSVPAGGTLAIDVRAPTQAEQQRVDAGVRALTPHLPGARLEVRGGMDRPPMPRSASAELFNLAQACAEELGLGPLDGREVGGGSDGNLTAAAGTPTLDGLGVVGAGAHANGEHAEIASLPERAALVAMLTERLRH